MKIVFKDFTFDFDKFKKAPHVVTPMARGIAFTIYSLTESEAYSKLEIFHVLRILKAKDLASDQQIKDCLAELVEVGAISKNKS